MAAKPKRVLIVDDALDVARLISSALGALETKLTVIVSPSAEEAMLESRREPVQLLIADIRLPGISGPEMVRKIRARNPELKVIIISGLSQVQVDRQMDGLKVDAFFQKPFEMSEFLDVAQRCLDSSTMVPALQPQTTPPEVAKALPPSDRLTLNATLEELRQNLNALAVVLLDEHDRTAASAGEFPGGELENRWAEPIRAALAGHSALTGLVQADPTQGGVLTLRGRSFDLVLASIQPCALVVAVRPGSSALRMGLAFEEVLRVQKELEGKIQPEPEKMEITAAPVATPEPIEVQAAPAQPEPAAPPDDPLLGDFAALLDQPVEQVRTDVANGFWESLVGSNTAKPLAAGVLSYEEARRMGLAPDSTD